MTDDPAPAAARAAALKQAFAEKGLLPDGFVEDFTRHAEEKLDHPQWRAHGGAGLDRCGIPGAAAGRCHRGGGRNGL